jgi:hypothetical protein
MNKGTDFLKILFKIFNKIRAHTKIVFKTGYSSLMLHINSLKKGGKKSSNHIRRQRNVCYI